MNTIIKKLSQIEEKSVEIIENGALKKRALTKEYERRTNAFDEALSRKSEQKLNALRSDMEAGINARIKEQEEEADKAIKRLEHHYETHHKFYVEHLFRKMTEV